MGRLFWAQTAYASINYCPDSIRFICRESIRQGLLIVGERDEKVVGAVGALASPVIANRDKLFAAELFWWVEPKYRNTGIGLEMLDGIEAAAKTLGVSAFAMMALQGVEHDKAAALYERRGYTLTEHTFMRAL